MNDESRYILRARDGDQASLRELYDRHRETIFRIAFRYTRSRQDAEDILQETFVRAFKALPSFDLERGTGFAAWIGRIGLHQTLELLRKRKRERRDLIIPLSGSNIDPPASLSFSPEKAAATAQTMDRLTAAFQELSPTQKMIFDLRFNRHLDIKEIAARLDVSPSSVKTHLKRASGKLRRRLEPLWREQ